MEKLETSKERLSDKTQLLLRFNYVSSVLSLVLGLFCTFKLHIQSPIPEVFYCYTVANIINVVLFKRHGNLTAMAIVTSLLSFISTLVISLYSGGINSPFVFVLAIIVLAGYVSTRLFGQVYLYSIIAVIVGLYVLKIKPLDIFYNAVPSDAQNHFSFICLMFSVYLLGGIFGRNLIKAHHKLYKSKAEVEQKILEKETLLREVHHRVKNNLQTVSSLLNLQSKGTDDSAIKNLIQSSQNRVTTMAMIHEMLYMRDDLSKIQYGPYVKELCEYLIKSYNGDMEGIQLKVAIKDIQLGIDTAIPLGLLINEVVTNSLKYGIHQKENGNISIDLKQENEVDYLLTISDNGRGFEGDIASMGKQSLGIKLINNLARQLKGSVIKDNVQEGTRYIVRFQDIKKGFAPTAP